MNFLYALSDDKSQSHLRGAFAINTVDAKTYNKKGYGIFFAVNSFKTSKRTEDNLKELTFWFIDMDEGSKDFQFQKIIDFKLVPTMVIETKNGHHVYWKCKGDVTVDEYKKIIDRLIFCFESDLNAKGVTRILRVPGYYHMKDPDRPYKIKKIFDSECSYTVNDMKESLPIINELIEEEKPINFSFFPTGDSFWKDVANINCLDGLKVLSGASELNNDRVETKISSSGKHQIIVNGKTVSSCWVDQYGQIGSHSNGGPYISNWINWYTKDWAETAIILKKYFPELIEGNNCLSGFGGVV